jgi:hypothetical protein
MRRAAAAMIPGMFDLANAHRSIRSFTDQLVNHTLLHDLLYTGLRGSSSRHLPVSGRYLI